MITAKTLSRSLRFASPHRFRHSASQKLSTRRLDEAQRRTVAQVAAEPFMNGTNAVYIEEMYQAWNENPNSVHKSWDTFFRSVQSDIPPGKAYMPPPSLVARGHAASLSPATSGIADVQSVRDHLAVQHIIRNYQNRGHNIADLDPLGINSADLDDSIPPELMLSTYNLMFEF